MKKIEKIEEIKTFTYKCEVCKTTHDTEFKALFCEKFCGCKHAKVRYSLTRIINTTSVSKVCASCGVLIESVSLEMPLYKLKKIFNFAKQLINDEGKSDVVMAGYITDSEIDKNGVKIIHGIELSHGSISKESYDNLMGSNNTNKVPPVVPPEYDNRGN